MSVKVQLFKGKTLSDGTHPVVLRINERGERFMIALPYSCRPNEWNSSKMKFTSKYEDHEYASKRVRKLYARAIRAIDYFNDNGIDFSERELFKKMVFEGEKKKSKDTMTMYQYFEKYLRRLEENEQYYRKDNFNSLKNRLFGSERSKAFFKKDFLFSKLNVGHLKDYVAHLKSEGLGGGIRNYMKDFRAIYYDALEEEVFECKKNPFKLLDFGKFSSDYNPRGLTVEGLKKLLQFDVTKYPDLKLSYYTFLFAYYCAGIRFTDLCKITYKDNVVGDKLIYKASKTGQRMPPVEIDDNIKFLMEQLDTGTEYILPFLNDTHKTEKQVFYRVKKCNKQYNGDLKKIQKLLGIDMKITSHVARHSVGSVLSEMGASMREIQGVFNHQRSDTTRHYIASLGYGEVSQVHKKLKLKV